MAALCTLNRSLLFDKSGLSERKETKYQGSSMVFSKRKGAGGGLCDQGRTRTPRARHPSPGNFTQFCFCVHRLIRPCGIHSKLDAGGNVIAAQEIQLVQDADPERAWTHRLGQALQGRLCRHTVRKGGD